MSKAPFMTVEFKVDRNEVKSVADCITDRLYDSFSEDTIEALGLQYSDFINEIIDMYEFSKMIKKGVETYGPDALDDPYDFMDFEMVTRTPAFKKLIDVCEMLEAVLNDADKHTRDQQNNANACADAIETLKRAGFKIVKA